MRRCRSALPVSPTERPDQLSASHPRSLQKNLFFILSALVLLFPNFLFFQKINFQVIGIQSLVKLIQVIVVPLQGTVLGGLPTPG